MTRAAARSRVRRAATAAALALALGAGAGCSCGERDASGPGRATPQPSDASREVVLAPIAAASLDVVVLVALDSAPAAAFSMYGYGLATTPALEALSREGVLVLDHVAASTGLNAAFCTLLTGRHPREHGVGSVRSLGRARLRESERTLAEAFREAGWKTLLSVAAPQLNPYLSGVDQGFDSLSVPGLQEEPRRADQVIGAALPVLSRWLGAGERVFVVLQLSDLEPRGNAVAPGDDGARWLEANLRPFAEHRADVAASLAKAERNPGAALAELDQLLRRARSSEPAIAWKRALRDGRASALDRELAKVLAALEESGRLRGALVAVQGLRGAVLEPPLESGGPRFLPEVVRTPLVIRFPGGRPSGPRDVLASAVDLPRALDSLLGLSLGESRFGTADLVAVAERAEAPEIEVAFLSDAAMERFGVVTREAHLERAIDPSGGLGDVAFSRAGALAQAPGATLALPPAARARLDEFSSPATIALVAGAAAPALEVRWRIESGFVSRVDVEGAGSEDRTSARDAARRRGGSALLAGGATLTLGLTERSADVRLDLAAPDGSAIDPERVLAGEPLSRSLVPRIAIPRDVPWGEVAGEGTEPESAPIVDVARASGAWWRFAVDAEGPCEALVTVWPPRRPHELLDVSAGGRVVAEAVEGRADVIRLTGEAPFDLSILKTASETFAFAVRIDGATVPATRVRVDGRRMALPSELSLVVPGWLPPWTDGLAPGAEPAREGEETGTPAWRIERVDPAGTFDARQAAPTDVRDLIRRLPTGE